VALIDRAEREIDMAVTSATQPRSFVGASLFLRCAGDFASN
jgi:hypothetical protein